MVNNASNDQRHTLEEITEKYWDERMSINLKHYLFAIQAVKKSMIKNKGGSIINLGSVSWIRGAVMFPAYSTAKAAIYGLTKSLARDLGQHNIRINSIAPGSVATKRQSKLWLNSRFKKEILDNQCLKKQILPEDISRMVLYLALGIMYLVKNKVSRLLVLCLIQKIIKKRIIQSIQYLVFLLKKF